MCAHFRSDSIVTGSRGGEEAIGGVGVGAVDDDLAVVGLAEAFVAGLVAGDEPVGVDHRGEAVGGLGRRCRGPRSGRRSSRRASWPRRASVGLEQLEVERVEVARVGERVADEHPVRRADGQRQRGEEVLVGLVDLVRPRRRRPSRSPGGTAAFRASPSLPMIRPVSSESSWLPRIRWTRSGYWHLSAATRSTSWCERSPPVLGVHSWSVDQLLQDEVPRRDAGRGPRQSSTFGTPAGCRAGRRRPSRRRRSSSVMIRPIGRASRGTARWPGGRWQDFRGSGMDRA